MTKAFGTSGRREEWLTASHAYIEGAEDEQELRTKEMGPMRREPRGKKGWRCETVCDELEERRLKAQEAQAKLENEIARRRAMLA